MLALMVGSSVPLHLWRPDVDFQLLITIVSSFHSLRSRRKVYDWLILFDREVEHIWRKEWNIAKVLFIISRYGLFFDIPVTVACKSDFIVMHRWDAGMLTGIPIVLQ